MQIQASLIAEFLSNLNLKLASAVAEFAMLLRNSEYKGESNYEYVMDIAQDIENEKAEELYELAEIANAIYNR